MRRTAGASGQRGTARALRRRAQNAAGAPASFANSSAVFLGPDYHFDLVQPGAALYGIAPVQGSPNPMRPTVRSRPAVWSN
jgi:alanine racemase